jgi:hypothetical protein
MAMIGNAFGDDSDDATVSDAPTVTATSSPAEPMRTEPIASAEPEPESDVSVAAPSTSAPVPTVEPVPSAPAPVPVAEVPAADEPADECHPSYDPCVPNASDVDCEGGSGNGPIYTGTVRVIGPDDYDLDRDGDGVGCE